jgi:hypothetical protein
MKTKKIGDFNIWHADNGGPDGGWVVEEWCAWGGIECRGYWATVAICPTEDKAKELVKRLKGVVRA